MLSTPFLLYVEFIHLPLGRIGFDIAVNVVVVGLVTDDVVMEGPLPNVFTVFLVAKTFERGYKSCKHRIPLRRGGRPRPPVFNPQKQMNVVGHNDVRIHR